MKTRTSRAALSALVLAPCATAQAQSPQPESTQTVVVSATKAPDQTKKELQAEQAKTPGGVTLVDTNELYQRNSATIADMLRYVPGAWAVSASGSDASFLSIRGSNLDAVDYDGSGIKLLQDGLPVTAADGNNHNRFIDPLSARYVVVARGANALTYGASTLGGAMDFISPTARDSAPLDLFVNGGSFGLVQGRFSASRVFGDFDGLVTLEAKQRDGYRDHNEQERVGLYANGGWRLGPAVQTRFFATYVKNDEQLPGQLTRDQWLTNPRQAEQAAIDGDYQWNVETWRLANRTTWELSPTSSLSLGLSYEEQWLYHPIVFAPPFFTLLINNKQRTFGASLRYNLRLDDHDLLAGVDYGKTRVDGGNYSYGGGAPTTIFQVNDNDADNTELFAMDRWTFAPSWTLVVGAQAVIGSRKTQGTDPATGAVVDGTAGDYDSVNPRVGLIHQLTPQVQLFANVSRVYEAPTMYQLDDLINDRPLDAMHGTMIEVGTRGEYTQGTARWYWDAALYYGKLKDEILSKQNPNAPGTSSAANFDTTVHAGLEALVGASFAAGDGRIEPLVNLTVNRFRFDGDPVYGNNKLPAAPSYAAKAELLYRHASGFFFGPTFDWVGQRYADFANTYRIDSYNLWGLRAGMVGTGWEVYAEARNLGDKNYIARSGVLDVAPPDAAILSPGEPRSLYVGARLQF